MDHRIGERQRWVWLASGLSAAVAACLCGLNWIWVLAGGAVVSLYYIYMDRQLRSKGLAELIRKLPGKIRMPLRVILLLWLVLLMAWTANLADAAFPMVDGFPVLGWTLLAVAAWGSWKGTGACARCGGVLCMFLMALYGVVAVFAVPDVQLQNLLPTGTWQDGIWTISVFLLPAAVWFLPCTRSRKRPAWQMAVILPAAAAILAAITCGVLSPALARSLSSPLYALAQSVSLFGVVERIEPLLSAAMTMGVFCLLSAMACVCRCLWSTKGKEKWVGVAACASAGVFMGWAKRIDYLLIVGGTIFFGAVLPQILLWNGKHNRNKATNSGSKE